MNLQQLFREKREWQSYMKKVKALPQDYQIVYRELQRYFFKVGLVQSDTQFDFLYDLIDLFELNAQKGIDVLSVTGHDVVAFADGIIDTLPTHHTNK